MSLSEKDPTEIVIVTFDFSAIATTVQSPEIAATLHSGVADETPQAIVSGSAQVDGATVLQQIAGGTAGANYALRCEVDTPDGQHFALVDVLPVRVQR
jgi:hypothetical protein